MLIDTHAHLNFEDFDQERGEIIDDCLSQDIWMVNVGTNQKTSKKAVSLAQKYKKGVYAAVGLHPYHIVNPETKESFNRNYYKNLAQNHKVKAIGEIGLDYTYTSKEKEKVLQKEAFKKQLRLAEDLDLPVIIHCREAWPDLIEILEDPNYKLQITNNHNGVAHFYSGSWNQAQKLFALGFLISFTGVVTFTDDYNEVIKKAPLERLMVETDCPYVAPEPNRGKKNKPQYVSYIAKEIAQIKARKESQVEKTTTKTAKKIFKLR